MKYHQSKQKQRHRVLRKIRIVPVIPIARDEIGQLLSSLGLKNEIESETVLNDEGYRGLILTLQPIIIELATPEIHHQKLPVYCYLFTIE